MRCSNCGTGNPLFGAVCSYCGVDKSSDQVKQVFAIFFGIIGGAAGWAVDSVTTMLMGVLIGFFVGDAIARLVNKVSG